MKALAVLVQDFNDRLTRRPGLLPKRVYVLELVEGPVFHLDGTTDRLVEGRPPGDPDCTIRASAEALQILLSDPGKATELVLTHRLTFDDAGSVMLLAIALKGLL